MPDEPVYCPQCGLTPSEHNNFACDFRYDSDLAEFRPETDEEFEHLKWEDFD